VGAGVGANVGAGVGTTLPVEPPETTVGEDTVSDFEPPPHAVNAKQLIPIRDKW
jgi:hypothetical protein